MMFELPVPCIDHTLLKRNMPMHYYLNPRLGSAESYMRSSFFHVPQIFMQAIASKSGDIRDDPNRHSDRAIGNATSTYHLDVTPTSIMHLMT